MDHFNEKEIGFKVLEADRFTAISQWYHLALLALTTLDGFTTHRRHSTPAWIAKRLGITRLEAELAIDRLKRLGLLAEKAGCLVQTESHFFVKDQPSLALRTYHQQILEKASAAITGQAVPSRDISGCTIPMDPARLPEANEIIRRFRRELMALMSSGKRASVYHLSVQLFRLDKEAVNDRA